MADFKNHITMGAITGFVSTSIISLCGWVTDSKTIMWMIIINVISSTLPDIDSKSSYTHKLINFITAISIGIFSMSVFKKYDTNLYYWIWSPVFIYGCIHYLLAKFAYKSMKHRAIWHSTPMALLIGFSSYLLLQYLGVDLIVSRWLGLSTFIGYMTHLLHDEFHSRVRLEDGHFKYDLKSSANSSWDMGKIDEWSTWLTYMLLLTEMGYILYNEWSW